MGTCRVNTVAGKASWTAGGGQRDTDLGQVWEEQHQKRTSQEPEPRSDSWSEPAQTLEGKQRTRRRERVSVPAGDGGPRAERPTKPMRYPVRPSM